MDLRRSQTQPGINVSGRRGSGTGSGSGKDIARPETSARPSMEAVASLGLWTNGRKKYVVLLHCIYWKPITVYYICNMFLSMNHSVCKPIKLTHQIIKSTMMNQKWQFKIFQKTPFYWTLWWRKYISFFMKTKYFHDILHSWKNYIYAYHYNVHVYGDVHKPLPN